MFLVLSVPVLRRYRQEHLQTNRSCFLRLAKGLCGCKSVILLVTTFSLVYVQVVWSLVEAPSNFRYLWEVGLKPGPQLYYTHAAATKEAAALWRKNWCISKIVNRRKGPHHLVASLRASTKVSFFNIFWAFDCKLINGLYGSCPWYLTTKKQTHVNNMWKHRLATAKRVKKFLGHTWILSFIVTFKIS